MANEHDLDPSPFARPVPDEVTALESTVEQGVTDYHLVHITVPDPEGWVTLNPDGSLEHGPAYVPSEATKVFWAHVWDLARLTLGANLTEAMWAEGRRRALADSTATDG